MVRYIQVNDLYRSDAVTIGIQATIKEALQRMDSEASNGLIVLDGDEVVGIISLQDIAGAAVPVEMQNNASLAGALFKEGYFEEAARKLLRHKVVDLMRTDFLSVTRQASILEIGADFLQNDLYIVPVIEEGKLLGVVTRTEIRQALTKALAA